MREVISRILEAEAEARRLREQTTQDTHLILQNARREAALLTESAARDAARQSTELITSTLADARTRQAEALAQATREIENQLRCSDETRQAWSLALARFLGGTP